MKKSMWLLVGILILMCGSSFAQDEYPKAEVFGGFSIVSFEGEPGSRESAYGFQANAAFNFHENIGIAADFGGQYAEIGEINVDFYEYLFGPRFSMRSDKATVFGHALFGGVHLGAEEHTEKGFAMGFGGGVDLNIHDRFAVRVVQFDWIPARFEGEWSNNTVRFGFGIVIK